MYMRAVARKGVAERCCFAVRDSSTVLQRRDATALHRPVFSRIPVDVALSSVEVCFFATPRWGESERCFCSCDAGPSHCCTLACTDTATHSRNSYV
jgi:hypothetical protein